MKLSVVIVNWNTADYLRNCLVSLADTMDRDTLDGDEVEVIVVDNASTDDSQFAAKGSFNFDVILLENETNVGFARANNQAIRQARSDLVLLLNPDTIVQPGALSTLVSFLKREAKVGAVGPQVLNPDGSLQTSCYPKPTLIGEFFRLFHLDVFVPYGSYQMSRWRRDSAREVDALLGACLLVRRSVLETVGYLDEGYFMYGEEIDLCYRMRRAGWQLFWVPGAKIVHYGGQSTKLMASEMFQQLYRGKLLYFRKNHGTLVAKGYKIILALATLARLSLTPFALFQEPQRRADSFVLARRYQHLLQRLPFM